MFSRAQHIVILCIISAHLPLLALADTWTWDGESPSTESWSDWTNWVGDSSAPVSDPGTDLIFGNSSHVFSSNNMGLFQLRDLTFVGSTSPHILGDNLQVFRSIVNSSSVDRGILAPITLGADATFRAANGGLFFAGTIDNAGNVLTIEGNSAVQVMSLSGSADLLFVGQRKLRWGDPMPIPAPRMYMAARSQRSLRTLFETVPASLCKVLPPPYSRWIPASSRPNRPGDRPAQSARTHC
jgi:hypothetical protein